MVQTKRGRGRPRKNNGEVTMVEENIVVPEEDVEAVPEVVEEELPMGNDPSILYAGREEHSLEIVHAGQRWLFKYKDLSGARKINVLMTLSNGIQRLGLSFQSLSIMLLL